MWRMYISGECTRCENVRRDLCEGGILVYLLSIYEEGFLCRV